MLKALMLGILVSLFGCVTRLSSAPATSAPALAGSRLSPQNTRITFIGTALMTSHQGTFTRFTGQLDCPDSDPAHAHISAEIAMVSVYTEISLLTKHLKQADFFDVPKYPRATFVSTHIERSSSPGNTHIITGDFTIHGITKSLSFPANFQVDGKSITLSATITIRQSDFKMESARTTTDDVPVTVWARIQHP